MAADPIDEDFRTAAIRVCPKCGRALTRTAGRTRTIEDGECRPCNTIYVNAGYARFALLRERVIARHRKAQRWDIPGGGDALSCPGRPVYDDGCDCYVCPQTGERAPNGPVGDGPSLVAGPLEARVAARHRSSIK